VKFNNAQLFCSEGHYPDIPWWWFLTQSLWQVQCKIEKLGPYDEIVFNICLIMQEPWYPRYFRTVSQPS